MAKRLTAYPLNLSADQNVGTAISLGIHSNSLQLSFTGDNIVTTDFDSELSELRREIAQRQLEIEDRQTLIEVLAEDGHDVLEQAIALNKDRAKLATTIARQFELIKAATQI